MRLTQLFAKVMVNKAADAAPEKIGEAVNKAKAWKAGERAPAPVTTLDKIMRFKPVILIVLILSLAGAIIMGRVADQYKPVWGKVRDAVVCQYGDANMENADYVRMNVVSAKAMGYFEKQFKTKSKTNTDLYEIYIVKDAEGRSALFCDSTFDTVDGLNGPGSYLFLKNSFPIMITGWITTINKQFCDYAGYSQLVTANMEKMDLIFGATPTKEKEGYVQSDEDKQKQQQWRMGVTVCEYIFAACVVSLFILHILKNQQIKKAAQVELEREKQKELCR